jgi:hypothetical protein
MKLNEYFPQDGLVLGGSENEEIGVVKAIAEEYVNNLSLNDYHVAEVEFCVSPVGVEYNYFVVLMEHMVEGIYIISDNQQVDGSYVYFEGDRMNITVFNGRVVMATGVIREVLDIEAEKNIFDIEQALKAFSEEASFISLTNDEIDLRTVEIRYAPIFKKMPENEFVYRFVPVWHIGPAWLDRYGTGQNVLNINAFDGSVVR